jgi:hypothetical protein
MTMMRHTLAAATLALLCTATYAQQSLCDQDARAPAQGVLPTDADRATFDRALVAYVARSVSTANDAVALANVLLWQRSAKFMQQPRQYVRSYRAHGGVYEGPAWTPEEQALWDALTTSALEQAGTALRPYSARLADSAFYAAWEVMLSRRMFVTYNCGDR